MNRVVFIIVLYTLIFLGGLYYISFAKYKIIFPARKDYVKPEKVAPRFKEIFLKTKENVEFVSWYSKQDVDKPAILYFHGNGETVSGFATAFNEFLDKGYNVLLVEYPSYAINGGTANEENVMQTAMAAYEFLQMEEKFTQIILYGFSIGTGVAVELASIVQPDFLVLEAPFSSVADVGEYWFKKLPVRFFVKDVFNSEKYVQNLPDTSLLIIHGTADKVVPYDLGKRLFETSTSKDKRLVTIKNAGHSELKINDSGAKVIKWLEQRIF